MKEIEKIGYNSKEEDNIVYEKYSASLSPNGKQKNKDGSAMKNSFSDIALLNSGKLRNFPSTIQPTDEKTMNRMIEYIQNAEFNEEDL